MFNNFHLYFYFLHVIPSSINSNGPNLERDFHEEYNGGCKEPLQLGIFVLPRNVLTNMPACKGNSSDSEDLY